MLLLALVHHCTDKMQHQEGTTGMIVCNTLPGFRKSVREKIRVAERINKCRLLWGGRRVQTPFFELEESDVLRVLLRLWNHKKRLI